MSKYDVTFANGSVYVIGADGNYQWFVADGAIEEQQAITAIKEVQSCQAEATTTKMTKGNKANNGDQSPT